MMSEIVSLVRMILIFCVGVMESDSGIFMVE